MKDIKKIEFYNPPTPQHEAVLEEKKAKEEAEIKTIKEEAKQEVIKEVIEETENPPKSTGWWIQTVLFWGMITYFVSVYMFIPVVERLKYSVENKSNTEEIQLLKQWTDEQTLQNKEERKTALCSKVKGEAKYCKDAKPLPTLTPTPVLKVIYPTQAP